jgi:hypothetical protein
VLATVMGFFFPTRMRLLFSKVLYLDTESAHVVLDATGRLLENDPDLNSFRAVILGKRAYFETIAEFPFSDTREIKSAVSLSPADYAPFETQMFFMRRLGRSRERTRVNLWFVRPWAVEELKSHSPWFIFPETALWSINDNKQPRLFCLDRGADQLMIHVNAEGAVHSSLGKNSGPQDFEAFCRSLGPQSRNCPVKQVSSRQQYFEQLTGSLEKAPLADLFVFFRWIPGHAAWDARFFRRAAASLSAVILLYLFIWAGLPLYVKQKLESENQVLSQNLGEVLDRQSDIETISNRIQTLAEPVESYLPKTALFDLLYEHMAGQSIVTRLTVAGRMVEIEGTSPRASDLLSTLSGLEALENVRLTRPLKKDRKTGHDQFSLSFSVIPGVFVNTSSPDGA